MTVSIKKMITHFINPNNTEFTACGLWTWEVTSFASPITSYEFNDITCKNCKRNKRLIQEFLISDPTERVINA